MCLHRPIARVQGSYSGLPAPGGTSIDYRRLVVPHVDGDGTARADSVDVLDHHGDRLVLDGVTLQEKDVLAGLLDKGTQVSATGWLVNGHRIVDYGYTNRSGSTYWRFDLNAACGK